MYLVLDFVNLPVKVSGSTRLDQFGCTSSYVSIASFYRPNEDYRLCGQRRGVKLVTTYNTVLIKFITTGLSDPAAGFSLIFRLIAQASSTTATGTTGKPIVTASIGQKQRPPPIVPFTTTVPPPPPPQPPTSSLTSIRANPMLMASSTVRYVRSMGSSFLFLFYFFTLNK